MDHAVDLGRSRSLDRPVTFAEEGSCPPEAEPIKDAAEELVVKIHFLAELQRECAEELDKLAAELEQQRLDVNKKLVAGSAVSLAGSAALVTAAFCTGGLLVPVLAYTGKAVSVLGAGINIGSEVVDAVTSEESKKETEIIGRLEECETEIKESMEALAGEADRLKVSREDYVTDRILKAIAKRHGLVLDVNVRILKLISSFSKEHHSFKKAYFHLAWSLESFLVYKMVMDFLPTTASVGAQAASRVVKSSVASTASRQAMKAAGSKATGKALKYATRGAFGILFSGTELIYNCVTMNDCETASSKRLKKMAKNLRTSSEKIEKELDAFKNMCEELADVKESIENKERSSKEKQTLMKSAMSRCEDEPLLRWLKENLESKTFSKLDDMYSFLSEEIDKQREKIDGDHIDITFVAHGCIGGPLIQASCLLLLPTIEDVILYTPWNCILKTDAIYGMTTGCLQPQHRIFSCSEDEGCKIPDKDHQPTKLPNHWNSMKKAGAQKIPNIHVSPLTPNDGVWQHVIFLQNKHGKPGRNRITIPFMPPGQKESIPFYVVTLALSLVLQFSNLKATLHLAACLGGSSQISSEEAKELNQQYCYTIDETLMTSSEKMLGNDDLSKLLKTIFD